MGNTSENNIGAVEGWKNGVEGGDRNYELDFLKLFFAVFIVLWHIRLKTNPVLIDTWLRIGGGGRVSVHFFFIVSGMLMANSIMKKKKSQTDLPGKSAIQFTLRKYKALALPYLISLALTTLVYEYIYADKPNLYLHLSKLFPDIFLIESAGTITSNL